MKRRPQDVKKPISRVVRTERRHRGAFRCEWCNCWTEVPIEEYWSRLHIGLKNRKKSEEALAENKKNVRFFCKRDGCVQSRVM